MFLRSYTQLVHDKLLKFPAVVLLGPRQCGKTTLAKAMEGRYYDVEVEAGQTRLDVEWDARANGNELVIIDEAQEAPGFFQRLRGTIDADRKKNGRYLLLGSVSPGLIKGVSESLAGRVAFVEMTPLVLAEIEANRMDDLWLRGGYPDGGFLDEAMFPEWQNNYLAALTASDLPKWGLNASAQLTRRLLQMLAALHGQPFNASQIGNSLSIDYKTVQRYTDFLEGAFLVRNLPAYYANIKKRLVKSPRVYIRDSGLLHALMRVNIMEALYGQPWLGQSWEGFVIEQILSSFAFKEGNPTPYYFRSSDGYEIDLVLDWGTERWAIEIKLTSNPSRQDTDRLNQAADWIDASKRFLMCRVAEPFGNEKLLVTNPISWLREDRKRSRR